MMVSFHRNILDQTWRPILFAIPIHLLPPPFPEIIQYAAVFLVVSIRKQVLIIL